jgi:hypothetical protein
MSKNHILDNVKRQVNEIVLRFNEQIIKDPKIYFVTRYKGEYLYLDRLKFDKTHPICRLKNNGKIDNWDFAIFKYSKETYDQDECFFPGSGFINGTIEGALKAGMKAYS